MDSFKAKSHPFYIIGTFGDVKADDLNHEIAHGLFFTNRDYREETCRILKEVSQEIRERINGFLQHSGGYHPTVWEDETHAYMTHNLDILKKKAGIEPDSVAEIASRLNLLFNQYY